MIIYKPDNIPLLDIPVDDTSFRHRALMQAKRVELHYALPEHMPLPLGAYINYQAERYTLRLPEHFEKLGSRNFEYRVTFGGNEELLRQFKYKLLAARPYKLKFPLTAKPRMFIQLLVDNLNLYDTGWSVGTCLEATEKPIAFNHEDCWAALARLAQEFNTEFEVVGKTIHLGKVEHFKDTPQPLSYGKGNGFVPGVGRVNEGERMPVEILYVQGGERNIDLAAYGSTTLLLPKSQRLEVDGRAYKTDAEGMYVTRADRAPVTFAEDSFDASHLYPQRVGEVTAIVVVPGKDTDGEEVAFYNITDSTIPPELNFRDCRLPGSKATLIFQSGLLAGREFDLVQTDKDLTGYDHPTRTFQLVSIQEEGATLPNTALCPKVGDRYAIFNIRLPEAYVCDNATQSGASWEMFRQAARYLREHEEQQFTFAGELDGLWAKRHWLEIGGKLIPGSYILFSDPQFQPQGVPIRITAVTDYINNPHSPKLELSNAPVAGYLQTDLGKLESEEVKNEQIRKEGLSTTLRRWRDAKEGLSMLEAAIAGFGAAINPITIQTMAMLVGDESLQFRFVTNKTNPAEVIPNLVYNQTTKQFTAPALMIQHMTLGVDRLSSSHKPSEYLYWQMEGYTSPPLDDTAALYLYARCRKGGTTGVYLLSQTPIKMDAGDGNYHLLYPYLGRE